MKILFWLLFYLLNIHLSSAAVVTHGGTLPDSSQKSDFYGLIDSATVSGIVNADVSSTAAIAGSKLDLTSAGTINATTLTTTGNIGIGSANPRQFLDISGGNMTIESTGSIQFGNDQNSFILNSASTNGDLKMGAGNTEIMRITNGGNVGIGTLFPSALLEVGSRKFDVFSGGNIGIGSLVPGQVLDVQGTIRGTGFAGNTLASIANYGASSSSSTAVTPTNLKVAFGSSATGAITNLPFTSSSTYYVTVTPISSVNTNTCTAVINSGSQFTLYGTVANCYWIAMGT